MYCVRVSSCVYLCFVLQGLACKLTALTAEAHNAKQRSRLVNNEEWDSPGIFGNKVSVGRAHTHTHTHTPHSSGIFGNKVGCTGTDTTHICTSASAGMWQPLAYDH